MAASLVPGRGGAQGGTQRIATCKVEVDWGQPLFVAVSVAVGSFAPLPTT